MSYFEFKDVSICGIVTALPENRVFLSSHTNLFEKSSCTEFIDRVGVVERRVAHPNQTASDLGFVAAKELLMSKEVATKDISSFLFLSKTPDYRNPPTAMVLHHRLGLDKDCLVYDVNIGNAGFVYALQLGCSFLKTMNGRFSLIIIGDTSSKQVGSESILGLQFGDAASAVLLEKSEGSETIKTLSESFGNLYDCFILKEGGFRLPNFANELGEMRKKEIQYESFITTELPRLMNDFYTKSGRTSEDFDLIALNQETRHLHDLLVDELNLPKEKAPSNLKMFGNCAGSSIPLLLIQYMMGSVEGPVKVLVSSFGEGLVLCAASFSLEPENFFFVTYSDEYFKEGAVDRVI